MSIDEQIAVLQAYKEGKTITCSNKEHPILGFETDIKRGGAHYFKNTLIISSGPQPVGKTYSVAGKREARKLASELNAQPWNF